MSIEVKRVCTLGGLIQVKPLNEAAELKPSKSKRHHHLEAEAYSEGDGSRAICHCATAMPAIEAVDLKEEQSLCQTAWEGSLKPAVLGLVAP